MTFLLFLWNCFNPVFYRYSSNFWYWSIPPYRYGFVKSILDFGSNYVTSIRLFISESIYFMYWILFIFYSLPINVFSCLLVEPMAVFVHFYIMRNRWFNLFEPPRNVFSDIFRFELSDFRVFALSLTAYSRRWCLKRNSSTPSPPSIPLGVFR